MCSNTRFKQIADEGQKWVQSYAQLVLCGVQSDGFTDSQSEDEEEYVYMSSHRDEFAGTLMSRPGLSQAVQHGINPALRVRFPPGPPLIEMVALVVF